MGLTAAQVDLEVYQNASLIHDVTISDNLHRVQSYYDYFNPDPYGGDGWRTNETAFHALMMWVRLSRDVPYCANDYYAGCVVDSINDFEIDIVNNYPDHWYFGKDVYDWDNPWDPDKRVGTTKLYMREVSDPFDLSETTFTIDMPTTVTARINPGKYYYDVTLFTRETPDHPWNSNNVGDEAQLTAKKLMYGNFTVIKPVTPFVPIDWVPEF